MSEEAVLFRFTATGERMHIVLPALDLIAEMRSRGVNATPVEGRTREEIAERLFAETVENVRLRGRLRELHEEILRIPETSEFTVEQARRVLANLHEIDSLHARLAVQMEPSLAVMRQMLMVGLDSFIERKTQKRPRLSRLHGSFATGESEETCCICLDGFVKDESIVTKLVCSHEFHMKCICAWEETNTACPVCREPLRTPTLMME